MYVYWAIDLLNQMKNILAILIVIDKFLSTKFVPIYILTNIVHVAYTFEYNMLWLHFLLCWCNRLSWSLELVLIYICLFEVICMKSHLCYIWELIFFPFFLLVLYFFLLRLFHTWVCNFGHCDLDNICYKYVSNIWLYCLATIPFLP